jgi:hypothetical protein
VLADATCFKSNTQTRSLSHESYLEWITLATISEQNPTHLQQSYDIHLLGQEYSIPNPELFLQVVFSCLQQILEETVAELLVAPASA